MEELGYAGLTLMLGIGTAVRTSMIGAIRLQRGGSEAVWISVITTTAGAGLILVIRDLAGTPASMRGLRPAYLWAGTVGLAFPLVLLAALRRDLGAPEAAWLSILGAMTAVALFLGSLTASPPTPPPASASIVVRPEPAWRSRWSPRGRPRRPRPSAPGPGPALRRRW